MTGFCREDWVGDDVMMDEVSSWVARGRERDEEDNRRVCSVSDERLRYL